MKRRIGLLILLLLAIGLCLAIYNRPVPPAPSSSPPQQTNSMPQQYTGQSLPFSYPKDTSPPADNAK